MDSECYPATGGEKNDASMCAGGNYTLVLEDATAMAGKTRTEIDIRNRVIRRTWKLMGFTRLRTYPLDDAVSVRIRDKSALVEGYAMEGFAVYLSVGGANMRIASPDDLDEARRIRDRIMGFLKAAAARSPDRDGRVSGMVQ